MSILDGSMASMDSDVEARSVRMDRSSMARPTEERTSVSSVWDGGKSNGGVGVGDDDDGDGDGVCSF